LAGDTRGSQIAEFALALPLIIVFVVGIYDFSQAFGLKQKLGNAAGVGARIASNQSSLDLTQATPATVTAVARAVGAYLQSVGLNDCGLASSPPSPLKANLKWTYSASTGCSSPLTLTIDRGVVTTANLNPPYTTMKVENTQVTLSYPYTWMFGNVITLLSPSSTYARGTSQLQGTATMQNLN
jgi:Flp pilus assembly protein TadG